MAGVAYSKPEIALKAALTYRSEIKHDTRMAEHLPLAAALQVVKLPLMKLAISRLKSLVQST